MKKLLFILTTFTAVSVVAPTIVACSGDKVKIENFKDKIIGNTDVKAKATALITSETETTKSELKEAIKKALEAELKEALKDKPEADAVAGFATSKDDAFEITLKKDGEKATVEITRKNWKDDFATVADKKEAQKKTFELIDTTKAILSITK